MTHGFGTPSVAVATTPTVISTFFQHLFARKKRKTASKASLSSGGPGGGPENQLSYEEGLKVIRRFLEFASHHGVEEVQAYTAMQLPTPHWVRRQVVTIPPNTIERAEEILAKHLSTYGPEGAEGGGLKLVGGSKWWRVRGRELEGEWIEMQKDYLTRKATAAAAAATKRASTSSDGIAANPTASSSQWRYLPHRQATIGSVKDNSGAEVVEDRVILYIHGGAFFFSSLDTHRYQVQRHARKAGARAFSPAYRLAPQYPFPCGLLDSLAAYLYLIDPPADAHAPILPTNIIFMGDSAGGGMVISLLVLIREMGLPLPAGASLISPWVDLTHSMPSIGGWDGGDFIPSSGFHYKPSCAWPPLPGDGVTLTMPDGSEEHYDEQIQMYCPNNLLTHPLVSPVNLGSLGGLCPLLIVGGGAELLRDEMTYLAHKAASPSTYPPGSSTLSQYPDQAALINKYKPTKVHLQLYEGCCHVVPTLSWTRSSKYMYRACANFNIWAFTAAQKAVERHLHHSHSHSSLKHPTQSRSSTLNGFTSTTDSTPSFGVSQASSTTASTVDLTKPIITPTAASEANNSSMDEADLESEASSDSDDSASIITDDDPVPPIGVVTVNGKEPLFGAGSIVAERVSTHGRIRPFEPSSAVPALHPDLKDSIGQIHGGGAIQKWLTKRREWDDKYASSLHKWREVRRADREKAEAHGFLTRELKGECPPLSALAGLYDRQLAQEVGKSVDVVSGRTSGAMGMWMKMGAKADKEHAGGDDLGEIKKNVENEQIRRQSVSRSAAQAQAQAHASAQASGRAEGTMMGGPSSIPEDRAVHQ